MINKFDQGLVWTVTLGGHFCDVELYDVRIDFKSGIYLNGKCGSG